MKYLKCFVLVVSFFMFCPIIKAKNTCSNSEIVKYQELAKNVSVKYETIEEENKVYFKVKINNLIPGLKIRDVDHDTYYGYTGGEIIIPNKFYQGFNYKFYIYADGVCSDKMMYTKYITMPFYNDYYNSVICEGIEEFELCQKWIKTPDYETMELRTQEYRKQKEAASQKKEVISKKNLIDYIIELYLERYYIILPIIIVGLFIIIISQNRKNKLF